MNNGLRRFAFRGGASSVAYRAWTLLNERGPMPIEQLAAHFNLPPGRVRGTCRAAIDAGVISDFMGIWAVGRNEPLPLTTRVRKPNPDRAPRARVNPFADLEAAWYGPRV